MRSPTLEIVRGRHGIKIPAVRTVEMAERKRKIRAAVLAAIALKCAVLVGWLGGVVWSWEMAREPMILKTPVFVREAPAACVLDGWDVAAESAAIPRGAIRALWMTDPARSRGWVSCWPLWEEGAR